MTPASEAQLARMLETFTLDPSVTAFDVGAFDHARTRMSHRDNWTRGRVWRARTWMAKRNALGSSIYLRPARSLEKHAWILVDGLTPDDLKALRSQYPPGLVVETSPGRFQAWVRVQRPVPVQFRTGLARAFARQCAASTGDADIDNPFGRVPGTTNRKPSRQLSNGFAPFATLRHFGREVVTVEIPAATETSAPGPVSEALEAGGRPNLSRRDFAIAARLVEAGRADEQIAAAIREVRGCTKPEQPDYIERTIRAARQRTSFRPTKRSLT